MCVCANHNNKEVASVKTDSMNSFLLASHWHGKGRGAGWGIAHLALVLKWKNRVKSCINLKYKLVYLDASLYGHMVWLALAGRGEQTLLSSNPS